MFLTVSHDGPPSSPPIIAAPSCPPVSRRILTGLSPARPSAPSPDPFLPPLPLASASFPIASTASLLSRPRCARSVPEATTTTGGRGQNGGARDFGILRNLVRPPPCILSRLPEQLVCRGLITAHFFVRQRPQRTSHSALTDCLRPRRRQIAKSSTVLTCQGRGLRLHVSSLLLSGQKQTVHTAWHASN